MTPLRRRLIEDMTVRNLAPTTQATYLYQVSMFARHFGRSPERLGPEQIRSYLVYLAMEKELAPSSISTAVGAPFPLQRDTPKTLGSGRSYSDTQSTRHVTGDPQPRGSSAVSGVSGTPEAPNHSDGLLCGGPADI